MTVSCVVCLQRKRKFHQEKVRQYKAEATALGYLPRPKIAKKETA